MEKPTIGELHTLRLKTFMNADSLYKEAKLLFEKGFYARAFLLSYFACEELGKIAIVVGLIGQIISGKEPNCKRFWKRFRDHKAKIDADDFHHYAFAIPTNLEKCSDLEWLENSNKSSKQRVDLKNASTYVDIISSGSQSPLDSISKHQASQMLERAFASLQAHWKTEKMTNPLVSEG